MIYDSLKYDDIDSKSFKTDFNMLADLLIMVLTGSEDIKLREPLLNSYDLFLQVREFINERNLDIPLITNSLGVPEGFMTDNNKCKTMTELDNRLKKSIFNFIYRLKCAGTKKEDQFNEITQALNHEFIKALTGGDGASGNGSGSSGANAGAGGAGGEKKLEAWDASPADY